MLALPQTQHCHATVTSHVRRYPTQAAFDAQHQGRHGTSRHRNQDTKRQKRSRQHSSAASNATGDSKSLTAEKWFNSSNTQPGVGPIYDDDSEPPYLLPYATSQNISTSNEASFHARNVAERHFDPKRQRSGSGSSSDEYRSVIDDLTIENKKLRDRLRKYEAKYNATLEEDKVFELKVHRPLPSNRMRELENTLQAFATSIDASSDDRSSLIPHGPEICPGFRPSTVKSSEKPGKPNTSPSTSHSPVFDSTNSSVPLTYPTPTSTLNLAVSTISQTRSSKDQGIKTFLHNISGGTLPHDASSMTDRQRKKLVVRRLEQLFTGKVDGIVGDHKQPIQQQEVSNAARAEQVTRNPLMAAEGLREARIFEGDDEMEGDAQPLLRSQSNSEEGIYKPSSSELSPEQRPTRPLDLDPDRVQNPVDNVEFIRHLGLSTPQLTTDYSGDVGHDAQGWIYLNLLIGMAQLHIINVTPDFVRSAIADVSDKFQLSRDGKKVRWRGGSEGTRLSSDSDNSSRNIYTPDDDSIDEMMNKRRRVENFDLMTSGGRIAAAAAAAARKMTSPPVSHGTVKTFQYKPLFYHRQDDESSMDGSASTGSSQSHSRVGLSWIGHFQDPKTTYSVKRKRDGPIVFYSGARFCTDLLGDREYSTGNSSSSHDNVSENSAASTPSEVVAVGASRNLAGQLLRTPSGSTLPFRPFKGNCSSRPLCNMQTGPKTPDLLVAELTDFDFVQECAPFRSPATTALQDFPVSGLGGTKPADHFSLTVETRIKKSDDTSRTKLSRFSAPKPNARRYMHKIPVGSLSKLSTLEADDMTAKLASLRTSSSLPPAATSITKNCFVRREILRTMCQPLEPSQLPEPTAFFEDSSSSEETSDSDDSYTGVAHLRNGPVIQRRRRSASEQHQQAPNVTQFNGAMNVDDGEDEAEEDERSESYESDESIDMLAHAREADPQAIAAQERDYEMEVNPSMFKHLPNFHIESLAGTEDESSGYSC